MRTVAVPAASRCSSGVAAAADPDLLSTLSNVFVFVVEHRYSVDFDALFVRTFMPAVALTGPDIYLDSSPSNGLFCKHPWVKRCAAFPFSYLVCGISARNCCCKT